MGKPPAVSVSGALARRLAARPSGGKPVRAPRRRHAGGPPRRTADVWRRLAARCDPAQFRPKLAPDVEVKSFPLRWGNDYVMIANPRALLHYRLEPNEAELLPLMDGTRTLKQIVVERLESSGDLDLAGVWDLVRQLHIGGFLDQPYTDVDAMVARALAPRRSLGRRIGAFARSQSVEWRGAHRLVRWVYDHGGRLLLRRAFVLPSAALAVSGLVAFAALVRSHRYSLGGSSLALEGLLLFLLSIFLTFVHELAHALVLVHFGRRVKSAGFAIYFGAPAFFVESSDGLMMDRRQRIAQSFAGPYSGMVLGGITTTIAWAFPDAAVSSLFYKFAVLNYFVLFSNLIPLLELDGYWILADLVQVPDLRPRSLAFVRHDLWHKLRRREPFSRQEVGLGLYGIVGVAFSIFSFYTAYFFWARIFGPLVTRMWGGGPSTRVLLVAIGAFVAGPLLRGVIDFGRLLGRRGRALLHALRFRLETRWRVEAAEMIDALPLFRDLPVETLDDLAGRVRLRTYHRGQPVVRQGEAASAFYVVRRGLLQVVEEDPDCGGVRPLRTLGRGDAFGELGLLQAAPRAATVRALQEAQVFEIDKGAFERLLAGTARTPPAFAPTVQAHEELRRLPPFARLEHDDLVELLRHGAWTNIHPGAVILRKGRAGDAFYAVGSGSVEVRDGRKVVATLGPGSYFGEIALLRDTPRTATVRALTPVRAFRVDRDGLRSDRPPDVAPRYAEPAGEDRPHLAPLTRSGGLMDCWHCRRTAVGSCRFCGRGICEDHVETQPFILELFKGSGVAKALVVEDALYCGACTPRPDPVELPELD